MEGIKASDYCHLSIFVYPPDNFPDNRSHSHGTAKLELLGSKGWLSCQTAYLGVFAEKHPEFEIVAFLVKESTGEKFRIGRLTVDEKGFGVLNRNFVSAGLKVEKSACVDQSYRIIVLATLNSGMPDNTVSTILLEGSFKIPFEIRDDRVVGFKKEAKVEEPADRQVYDKNPLFKKVEPFQPAIPNTVWWQIGIQPVYEYRYLQHDYCPRRKQSKAVF